MEHEGKSWATWMDELELKADHTRYVYVKAMERFLEQAGMTAEELFESHYSALSSRDPRDKLRIPRLVQKAMKELQDGGLSSSSAYSVHKAVSSFFAANGLEFRIRSNHKLRVFHEGSRIVNAAQIRELLGMAGSFQNKALVLALKDSGLRVSDIVKLDWGHVRKAIEDGDDFALVRVRQEKGGRIARPIFGPESLEAIGRLADHRRQNGGMSDSDPVFTYVERPKAGQRMIALSATGVMSNLAKRAGLEKVSAHSLRKFHTTMLQAGGMPEPWIALVQGRVINDSRAAYVKPTDEQLVEAYREAYPKVAALEATEAGGGKRVGELEERIAELERLVATAVGATARMGRRALEAKGIDTSKPLHEAAAEAGWPPEGYQMPIDRGEAEGYVRRGWKVVMDLGNGRCLVEKA